MPALTCIILDMLNRKNVRPMIQCVARNSIGICRANTILEATVPPRAGEVHTANTLPMTTGSTNTRKHTNPRSLPKRMAKLTQKLSPGDRVSNARTVLESLSTPKNPQPCTYNASLHSRQARLCYDLFDITAWAVQGLTF